MRNFGAVWTASAGLWLTMFGAAGVATACVVAGVFVVLAAVFVLLDVEELR